MSKCNPAKDGTMSLSHKMRYQNAVDGSHVHMQHISFNFLIYCVWANKNELGTGNMLVLPGMMSGARVTHPSPSG